jgi:hypothetical protein
MLFDMLLVLTNEVSLKSIFNALFDFTLNSVAQCSPTKLLLALGSGVTLVFIVENLYSFELGVR